MPLVKLPVAHLFKNEHEQTVRWSAAMKTPLLYIAMESKCHMEFSYLVVHSLIVVLCEGLDTDAVELPTNVYIKCRRIWYSWGERCKNPNYALTYKMHILN